MESESNILGIPVTVFKFRLSKLKIDSERDRAWRESKRVGNVVFGDHGADDFDLEERSLEAARRQLRDCDVVSFRLAAAHPTRISTRMHTKQLDSPAPEARTTNQ